MKRKFWLILLVVSLFLSGIGCKKKIEEKPEEAPVVKVEEKAAVKGVKPTRMNDDLWVELTAQKQLMLEKYTDKVEAGEMGIEAGWLVEEEFEKVLGKYGITKEEFDNYTAEMDEFRAMELALRVFQRLDELRGQ
ncbi:hypothetical protein ES703_39556 [subsurface metagenome]